MTVIRNYVEPQWWAKLLYAPYIVWNYEHLPPVRWVMDAVFDAYKWAARKPADYYGWWDPLSRVSLIGQLKGFLGLSIARAALRALGYELISFELGVSNELRCRGCDQFDDSCECDYGERELYVSNTTFSVDGIQVPDEVFQAEFDRFYRLRANGQFIQRIPHHQPGLPQ